jgi:polyhydroxyalkanoate synthesis regulator phasin
VRKKLVIAASAGVLTLSGLAVAVPALADPSPTTAGAGASAVERIKSALSGLVSDGSISQEQADEVATTLGDAGIGHGHGGAHGGGWPDLAVAATALGMTEDELATALQADGASLATVAGQQGVSVDTLVAALTDAVEARMAQAVTDGRITQEQADQRLADLAERITERVNATDADRHGGPGWWGGPRGGGEPDADGTPAD